MLLRFAGFFLILSMLAAAQVPFSQKKLILHDFQVGPHPNPTFVRDNLAYLETLPIDGLFVYMRDPRWITNATSSVLAPVPMSVDAIRSVLSPVAGLRSQKITNNFGLIFAGPGLDMFDDSLWSVRLQNVANLAQALREAGLKGIAFDNESYLDWSRYGGASCSTSHTLKQCQDQARLRGQQLMAAMTSQFPDIVVLLFDGPWVSDNTFYDRSRLDNVANANQLSGPLFVGMVEAKGIATIVDGGEFYTSRSGADFAARYQDQKYGIASDIGTVADDRSRAAGPNGFIPASLRPDWGSRISAGAGLLDRSTGMNSSVLQTMVSQALNTVDEYVWLYTESLTFLKPPGTYRTAAPSDWVGALIAARQPLSLTTTSVSVPSGTTFLSAWQEQYSSNGWGPIEKNMSNGEKPPGDGRTLSIRGQTFAMGLGVHASSEVIYTIGGTCSTFRAVIGVDDEVANADDTLYRDSSVQFQVWADGTQLYQSGLLNRRSAPVVINLDVSGRNSLRLVVLGGPSGEAYAHADWANAQLTCP